MERFYYIAFKLEQFSDTIVTLMVATISLGALSEVTTIIAGVLAIVYWLPKIKREISINYGNKLKTYIKSMFKRNAKYK